MQRRSLGSCEWPRSRAPSERERLAPAAQCACSPRLGAWSRSTAAAAALPERAAVQAAAQPARTTLFLSRICREKRWRSNRGLARRCTLPPSAVLLARCKPSPASDARNPGAQTYAGRPSHRAPSWSPPPPPPRRCWPCTLGARTRVTTRLLARSETGGGFRSGLVILLGIKGQYHRCGTMAGEIRASARV